MPNGCEADAAGTHPTAIAAAGTFEAAALSPVFCLLVTLASSFGVSVELGATHSVLRCLSYYTVQSNVLAAVVCLLGARTRRRSRAQLVLQAGVTIWISVTALVFAVFLAHRFSFSGIRAYGDIALHYFAPAVVLLDWVLLEPKGALRLRHAFLWASYPIVYVVLSLVRGHIDGFYPYWFLDPVHRYPRGMGSHLAVGLFVLGLFVFFGLLGACLIKMDGGVPNGRRAGVGH